MIPPALDKRRNAYRDNLAAEELRGKVPAPNFTPGALRQVIHPAAPLRAGPDPRQSWTTEALFGESVRVYDEADGWVWIQLERDRYVGYTRADALSSNTSRPTHRVKALGTWIYPDGNLKAPPLMPLPMNALVSVAGMDLGFARLVDGTFIPSGHLAAQGQFAADFVAIAEQFTGVPYVWGGKTQLGLDCSGLIQTALHAAGLDCPRDTDMQQAEIGAALPTPTDLDGLVRGDLVFWPRHVGVMTDSETLLHANAHHMAVAAEPLREATVRIAATGASVAAVKRMTTKRA